MEEHDQPAQERSELNKDSRSNSNSPNRSPGNTTGCQNQTTVSSISFLFSSIGKKGVEMAKLAAEKTQSAYEKHIASPQGGGQASKEMSTMSKVSVFGIGLEPHLMISNSKLNLRDRVPKLVLECVAYIEDQGINELGIYRLSGSTREINLLRVEYDSKYSVDLKNWENGYIDPNAVASLFKAYVRELPECLLGSEDVVDDFQALFVPFNESDTNFRDDMIENDNHSVLHNERLLYSLEKLISKHVSSYNRDFLAVLLAHLRKISLNEPVNKMGINNLQVVWSPTLRFGGALFMMLVLQHERLFPINSNPLPFPIDVKSSRSSSPFSLLDSSFSPLLDANTNMGELGNVSRPARNTRSALEASNHISSNGNHIKRVPPALPPRSGSSSSLSKGSASRSDSSSHLSKPKMTKNDSQESQIPSNGGSKPLPKVPIDQTIAIPMSTPHKSETKKDTSDLNDFSSNDSLKTPAPLSPFPDFSSLNFGFETSNDVEQFIKREVHPPVKPPRYRTPPPMN